MMRPAWKSIVLLVAMTYPCQFASAAGGWIRDLTVTSIGENDIGGEVVQFTVREEISNSVRCPDLSGYAIRDPATLRGALALLMSSLVAQHKVDLFLTGTCDSTGMPGVIGVVIH
jgi:hypothetical protein